MIKMSVNKRIENNCEHWDKFNKKNDAFEYVKHTVEGYQWQCKFCGYITYTNDRNPRPIIAKEIYSGDLYILTDYEKIN